MISKTLLLCLFLSSCVSFPTDPVSRNFHTSQNNPNVKVFSTYPTKAPVEVSDSQNDLSKGTGISKDVINEETAVKGESIKAQENEATQSKTHMMETKMVKPGEGPATSGVVLPPITPLLNSSPQFTVIQEMASGEGGEEDTMNEQEMNSFMVMDEDEEESFRSSMDENMAFQGTGAFPGIFGDDSLLGSFAGVFDDDDTRENEQIILPIGIVAAEQPMVDIGRPLNMEAMPMEKSMPQTPEMPKPIAEIEVDPNFQPIAAMDEAFSLPSENPAVEMNEMTSEDEMKMNKEPGVAAPMGESMVPLVEAEVSMTETPMETESATEMTPEKTMVREEPEMTTVEPAMVEENEASAIGENIAKSLMQSKSPDANDLPVLEAKEMPTEMEKMPMEEKMVPKEELMEANTEMPISENEKEMSVIENTMVEEVDSATENTVIVAEKDVTNMVDTVTAMPEKDSTMPVKEMMMAEKDMSAMKEEEIMLAKEAVPMELISEAPVEVVTEVDVLTTESTVSNVEEVALPDEDPLLNETI